jgi:hypothetical protein
LLTLFTSHSVYAESDLTRTITGASEVRADVALEALAGKKNYYETVVSAEFIIQRDKGLMMGRFVSNSGWKITILDLGSPKNSYKILSTRSSGGVQS